MRTRRGLGFIPSKPDAVGTSTVALYGSAGSPPSRVDWIQYLHDTRDQWSTQSCVGQSNAHGIYIREGILQVPDRELPSASYIYWGGRREAGQEHLDMGSIPSLAIKAMKDLGYCSEKVFPFDADKINVAPGWEQVQAAYDQRLAESYRITESGWNRCDEVRKALADGFPVVYGLTIDQSFEDYTGGILGPQTGNVLGRHMTCLFGYNDDCVFGINSWGSDWGETWEEDTREVKGGIYRLSWEAIAWDGASDFWCHTSVKGIPEVK